MTISEEDETPAFNQDEIDVHYVAQMNVDEPDEDTKNEIRNLLQKIKADAQKVKPAFVRPQYDFELLAPFLGRATTDFRQLWDKYLSNESSYRKPWQTVKAFNYRMTWGQDDYKDCDFCVCDFCVLTAKSHFAILASESNPFPVYLFLSPSGRKELYKK